MFSKAESFLQRGNHDRALEYLGEALKINPNHPDYLSFKGLCISLAGDTIEGEKMCRRAVSLDSKSPTVFVNLGKVLLEQGLRNEARKMFTKAYKIDNTNAPAALELSRMGVRRHSVLPFLDRSHPFNKSLGKLRALLLTRKDPGLKKL